MDTLFEEDDAGAAPTLTVGELSARIAQLTSSAFPAELWVSGQMRNLNRSNAGHVYFDLAEPAPAGALPRTQLPVTLLEPERKYVNRQLMRAGGAVRMEDGIEVRISGRLNWYAPRGVLQFKMHGIDPAFTLGRLQADRERLLRVLTAEGLLDANRQLPLPAVPLRIGLVTSRGTAAFADVQHELASAGVGFTVRFADARTQGGDCGPSVVRALHRLAADRVDLILLVRGGGARTDLAGFDGEDIARAIAAMPVPVFTGIGHEVDRSIADEVAHSAHKTPTAAAGAVVDHVNEFLARLDTVWAHARRAALSAAGTAEGRLDRRAGRIAKATRRVLDRHGAALDDHAHRTTLRGRRGLDRAEDRLASLAAAVGPRARRDLRTAEDRIATAAARAMVHDPAIALARGWSITTTSDGRAVRSVAELSPGTVLHTRIADGTVRSTVVEVRPQAPAPTPTNDSPTDLPEEQA